MIGLKVYVCKRQDKMTVNAIEVVVLLYSPTHGHLSSEKKQYEFEDAKLVSHFASECL